MDGINTGNNFTDTANKAALRSSAEPSNNTQSNTSSAVNHKSVKANLTSISLLSAQTQQSSPELRQDIIDRAKSLINDPNWLTDNNLDILADKIGEIENI